MGKSLRADIIIGGKADNSFYRLGNTLEQLGSQVSIISDKLLDFGKESVEAYVGYEDAMLDAQVALRTQYESASELGRVMEELDKSALQWASDSRFTTEDVAGAISNAAHAGWDLEQILKGVPAAMDISLAGSMGLAEGLEYLVDISNAAGIGFDDLGEMVDYWAYAANRSSTTIPEMGQAMQKMGATMQFVKGDMAGLTTMLAVLANNGAKGTEAGTLLRNSMIRLIAPTKSAADAMDMLELSAEELEEIYADSGGMEEAAKLLEEAGFSAYNAKGDLKSFLDIFQELNAATSTMTEQDRNKVLSAIFPTRTITGALALLDAAANGWDGLYDSIQRNGSGYAEYAAETMESGLGGVLRHLESVYDALETKTGGALEESISNIANDIAGMIDAINQMDDKTFGAIVSGLEVIAVAGPGMVAAGGAIKTIAWVLGSSPATKILLGATAIASLTAGIADYIDAVSDERFQNAFGDNSLNMEMLESYTSGLSAMFSNGADEIGQYNQAVEEAISQYETVSSKFTSELMTATITEKELTQADKDALVSYGNQIYQAIVAGIDGSYSLAEESVANMMGDGLSAEEIAGGDYGVWTSIIETLNYGYEGAKDQATALSGELAQAITDAFTDNIIDETELQNLRGILDKMNKLESYQSMAESAVLEEKAFRKAQALGIDGLNEGAEILGDARDAALVGWEDAYYYGFEQYVRSGWERMDNDPTFTAQEFEEGKSALWDTYQQQVKETNNEYLSGIGRLYDSAARDSEFGQGWEEVMLASEKLLTANEYSYDGLYLDDDINEFNELMISYFKTIGGADKAVSLAKNGDYNAAKMVVAYQLANRDLGVQSEYGGMFASGNELDEGIAIAVDGDTTTLQATIEAEDGKTLLEYIDGDAEGLTAAIYAEDGKTLLENVDGDISALSAAIEAYNGKTITVNVAYRSAGGTGAAMRLFAEGGRAEEASIFGEAGPEWAIPEEHSQRTAELLDAARQASGFTWPELLTRNGGLNAGRGGDYTLVYSPTIVARDATDVEQKLKEDKKRLEKWLRDRQLHDNIEVYA